MSTVLNRASRNFLWQHPWQLGLAIAGIALGVAVVIAIELAMESSLAAFGQAGKALSGGASYRIVASDGGLGEKCYRRLRVEKGIHQLSPVVKGYVRLSKPGGRVFNLIGVDPFIEKSFQSIWQARENEGKSKAWISPLVAEPNTAVISQQTASSLALRIGDELTVDAGQGEQGLKIVGLLFPDNAVSEELSANLIMTDIATAQEVLGLVGRLSYIDVLVDQYNSERLAAIRKSLPADALLVSLESQSQAMREMTRAFAINLKALGLLSLLVGMFLIYNTVTFLVLQRRRLIGGLRSIGVTRGQIFKLIIGEAMLLAALGTMIGIILGIVLGQGLLGLISGTINAIYFHIDAAALMITPMQLAKGAFLGFAATLLAVLPPAFEATRISPVTVLTRSQLESGIRRLLKAANRIGCAFIFGGVALAYGSGNSIALGLASIFLLLFGFAMLTPLLTLMLMKLMEKLFGRTAGVFACLPFRMISAEISRTGIAIAALMIAVAATIGMDLMIGSFRQTVADWLQTTLRADLYISLPGEKTPGFRAEKDHRLKDKVAALQDVDRLSSVLSTQMLADGDLTKVSVYEMNEKSRTGFVFKHKAAIDLWQRFERQPSVIVTEPYAYRHDVKIGGEIRLRTDRGDRAFTVIGIYADYSGDQGHLAMSRRNYQKYWPDLGYSGIGVYARDGADIKNLEIQLSQLVNTQQSIKSSRAIYNASMTQFEQTFTITETLRWLSAMIAFAGVFSALMAIQFERAHELGILRAIGVAPGQLTALIIGETALMGLVAGLIAVPVGHVVAYLLIFVIYQRSFGWALAFHSDATVLCQGLALALIASILAGIFPALKMAQTRPSEALRAE